MINSTQENSLGLYAMYIYHPEIILLTSNRRPSYSWILFGDRTLKDPSQTFFILFGDNAEEFIIVYKDRDRFRGCIVAHDQIVTCAFESSIKQSVLIAEQRATEFLSISYMRNDDPFADLNFTKRPTFKQKKMIKDFGLDSNIIADRLNASRAIKAAIFYERWKNYYKEIFKRFISQGCPIFDMLEKEVINECLVKE